MRTETNFTPRNLRDAIEYYAENGGHFFDRATMRFFRSRVSKYLLPNRCFVTSEQYDDKTPRLYTVRRFRADFCEVDTVGEFQQYRTSAQAKKAAEAVTD